MAFEALGLLPGAARRERGWRRSRRLRRLTLPNPLYLAGAL